jgi:hypothetical protein
MAKKSKSWLALLLVLSLMLSLFYCITTSADAGAMATVIEAKAQNQGIFGYTKITLKLDNGETVDATDIKFATEDEAQIYTAMLDMGVNAAVANKEFILNSSTEGSTKKFKVTVDDTGALTAVEITE